MSEPTDLVSADLLRSAAGLLDQVTRGDTYVRVRPGKPAKPEPIEADVIFDCSDTGEITGIEVIGAVEVTVDGVRFGPQVAAPLAAWLRTEADSAYKEPSAVDLARAILDEETTDE